MACSLLISGIWTPVDGTLTHNYYLLEHCGKSYLTVRSDFGDYTLGGVLRHGETRCFFSEGNCQPHQVERLAEIALVLRNVSKTVSRCREYKCFCFLEADKFYFIGLLQNGFKCHTTSEAHQRQLLLFGENPNGFLGTFSSDFEKGYMDILRRQYGGRRVAANQIYQDYIKDKQHVHMNATKWMSLTGFVTYLGKSGKHVTAHQQ